MLNDIEKIKEKLKQHFDCDDYVFRAFRVNDEEITFWFIDLTVGAEEFSISSTDEITDMQGYIDEKIFIKLKELGYVK